jgi:hypothetical protein
MKSIALLLLMMPAAFASPVITVQPGSLGPSQMFTAAIAISGVGDLYAFQFDLSFSPSVIAATSISEGSFLAAGGPTIFIPGSINNTSGTVAFTADSLLGSGPGVSGSGILANVSFRGVGQGTSPITLLNVEFLDSTLTPIVVTTVAGQSPQIAPEPYSAALLVCGSLLLLGLSGWVRKSLAFAHG